MMMMILMTIPVVAVITKWCWNAMVECAIDDFKTTIGMK